MDLLQERFLMKKTHSSEKVTSFFTKNLGLVGLLTIINLLLIYFVFDKLQSVDERVQKLEGTTNSVVKEMNNMSQPIVEEESTPAKK